ncbi:hypothetical protein UA44_07175 [Klebsiella aerogenes]|nr:hypothetical protein UA44_07175 [Klebsiella aerogenes]
MPGFKPGLPTEHPDRPVNRNANQRGQNEANAVLLHSCEVTSGTPGCYRQAVCLGSALNVSAQ